MKSYFQKLLVSIPIWLSVFTIGFVIASCAPVRQTNEYLWSPLITPSVTQTANESDCFVKTELIPGKTSKQQVQELWGEPRRIRYPESTVQTWEYRSEWIVDVDFIYDKISEVVFLLSRCTLGEIIDEMGSPEILALRTLVPDVMPSENQRRTLYVIIFHYPSQGFGFEIVCSNVLAEEECLKFFPGDEIDLKRFYKRNSKIEDLIGDDDRTKIIQWSGFDK